MLCKPETPGHVEKFKVPVWAKNTPTFAVAYATKKEARRKSYLRLARHKKSPDDNFSRSPYALQFTGSSPK